ncbi:MAG: cob(I)yrinic acid a,c-diamide adenosyltransferase [Planctomycetaceae bacterium]|nr:cob(I)yrinic acid a,c-diamide adenosyltransferase [Planctomycetaceae bacterium]
MTIYTRTGDRGETDLLDGPRVPKDTVRLEACGDLDELDAWLGLARCEKLPDGAAAILERIQRRLVDLRAELVSAKSEAGEAQCSEVAALEQAIDCYEANLAPLEEFILPGGSRAAATLHVARAVCRRAERRLVTLTRTEPAAVSSRCLAYINRLSDLLFVLARAANGHAGIADTPS